MSNSIEFKSNPIQFARKHKLRHRHKHRHPVYCHATRSFPLTPHWYPPKQQFPNNNWFDTMRCRRLGSGTGFDYRSSRKWIVFFGIMRASQNEMKYKPSWFDYMWITFDERTSELTNVCLFCKTLVVLFVFFLRYHRKGRKEPKKRKGWRRRIQARTRIQGGW